jgi:hypothetical protein
LHFLFFFNFCGCFKYLGLIKDFCSNNTVIYFYLSSTGVDRLFVVNTTFDNLTSSGDYAVGIFISTNYPSIFVLNCTFLNVVSNSTSSYAGAIDFLMYNYPSSAVHSIVGNSFFNITAYKSVIYLHGIFLNFSFSENNFTEIVAIYAGGVFFFFFLKK